jgi:catechol 2,3-dioxygenase-like lactoylglutathione lyase family enzyme
MPPILPTLAPSSSDTNIGALQGISGIEETMGRAVMIGGVFLPSRDPEGLAEWYRRHLGWELAFLPDEGYYTELYFRDDDDPEQRQHLVFAIMPGDPGNGEGHIVNYRVEDIEAVVASLHQGGIETSPIRSDRTPRVKASLLGFTTPKVIGSKLWEHL